jgi:hypothetical protein
MHYSMDLGNLTIILVPMSSSADVGCSILSKIENCMSVSLILLNVFNLSDVFLDLEKHILFLI